MSLRVLHVIPAIAPRYGGPSAAIVPLCRSLAELGAEPLVATTDADGSRRLPVSLGQPTTWSGIPAIFFQKRFSESYKYSPSLASWLSVHVCDFDIVHIHAVLSHACLAAAAECIRHDVPYIVRPLGTLVPWSLGQRPFRKRLLLAIRGRTVLERASAIHYTSPEEKHLVETTLGLSAGFVVPLGVEPDLLELVIDDAQRERDPCVLTMSRLHPKKNLEAVIDAFLDASLDCRSSWRLVIAGTGDPDYVASLRRRVDERQASSRVSFVGWVEGDAKLALMRSASVMMLCSKHENFGLAALEAMAVGVPVVLSREVDLSTEVQRAGAGWISDNLDESLRAALADAIGNSESRRSRSRAAREFARSFTWPVIGSQLIRRYSDVLLARTPTGSFA